MSTKDELNPDSKSFTVHDEIKKFESNTSSSNEFIENRDFYLENGFYVFTSEYLKKRGYCCKSGCRHCPY